VVNQSVWYVLSDKRHAKCLADFESKIRSALKRSGKVAQSTDPGHNRPGTTHRVREHKQAKYGLRQRRQRQKLPNNFFSAQIPVSSGQNPISVTARDGDGNVGTQSWTVTIPSGGTTTLSYDANGNTLTDPGHTYTYDRLDRLSTVTWPDGSTLSITYDPLGLRNEEVLKNSSGTVIADNRPRRSAIFSALLFKLGSSYG
jgi:YD repeat-containing protein